MGANDPKDMANLEPRDMVGNICNICNIVYNFVAE